MAMTLADVRAKYPDAYKNVDDQTLADAIYKKYYPQADRREFDARIGLKPYQNTLEAMGTAVAGVPGRMATGAAGLEQMVNESGFGGDEELVGRLGLPSYNRIDENNPADIRFMDWASKRLGTTSVPEILAFAKTAEAKKAYETYARSPEGGAYKRAEVELEAELRRQELAKTTPAMDVSPGSAEAIVGGAIGSVAEMTPALLASVVTRNPIPAMAYAGASVAGTAYGEGRDQNLDPEAARQYALLYGAAEGVSELLPLSVVLKEGGNILWKATKGAAAEGIQEGFTEGIQFLLDKGYLEPDMPWGEAWPRIQQAALTGAVAGPAMVAIASGAQAATRGVRNLYKGTALENAPVDGAIDPTPAPDTGEEPAVEEVMALPAPATLLALPPPSSDNRPPVFDFRDTNVKVTPETNTDEERIALAEAELDREARIALQRTRQTETAELLKTARETITPLGTFSPNELDQAVSRSRVNVQTLPDNKVRVQYGRNGPLRDGIMDPVTGKITSAELEADQAAADARGEYVDAEGFLRPGAKRSGMSPAQRVQAWRVRTGRSTDAPITIEDLGRARVPQSDIDAIVASRRPMATTEMLAPLDITRAAESKNLVADDTNFFELALRSTGQRDPAKMSQVQLRAFKSVLDALPVNATKSTVPLADAPVFTEAQYGNAVAAVRRQGRYTFGAIKEATGLRNDKEVASIRDAMVRRGQLVQRGENDYRLYDIVGKERQAVPDDLPPGAFKEHVVRRIPVDKVRIRKDGKSIGTFGSASEARGKVNDIRMAEAKEGVKQASVAVEPAGDVAYGVMENRYDERGNLLGQVVVDTYRDEGSATKAADALNAPSDVGPRYTSEPVAPASQVVDEQGYTPEEAETMRGTLDERVSELPEVQQLRAEYESLSQQVNAGMSTGDRTAAALPAAEARVLMDRQGAIRARVEQLRKEVRNKRADAVYARDLRRQGQTPKAPSQSRPPPAALAGRSAEIVANLDKQMTKRGLPLLGTKVQLRGELKTAKGERVEGFFLNDVINIATAHLDPALSVEETTAVLAGVMDHELIHALRKAGVLSPETAGWKALSRYVAKTKRPDSRETYLQWTKRNYTDRPGYVTQDDMVEEAIAEAFRHWAANRRNVTGQPATVFRQLVQWFRNLINAVPADIFNKIETGQLVREALTPPGSAMPRAKAAATMQQARKDIAKAEAVPAADVPQQAQRDTQVRKAGRQFLRAKAQSREDRYGKSGPKTVLGTTPSAAYATGDLMDRLWVADTVSRYREQGGLSGSRLNTYLPIDLPWLERVADAQQRAAHAPKNDAVAKAYRALIAEIKRMYQAIGKIAVTPWTEDGSPYKSSAEIGADLKAGVLKLRLSNTMFGPGADNPAHPMNEPSGLAAVDGTPLTNNDLLRVVHEVYGYGQSGFRPDERGAYNAYHEHARLLSPEAQLALATETLAQDAWHHAGRPFRRPDGSLPRIDDADYLADSSKEFAEQKAFLLPRELISSDPGWKIAAEVPTVLAANEEPRYMVGWHGTPHRFDKFSNEKIGTGEGNQSFGWGLYFAGKKEVAEHYQRGLSRGNTSDVAKAWADIANDDWALAAREYDTWAKDHVPGFDSVTDPVAQELRKGKPGSLYKVDIPDDSELLVWDAPLSEQPMELRAKLQSVINAAPKPGLFADDKRKTMTWALKELDSASKTETGAGFYSTLKMALGGDRPASEALKAAGIPGHKYKDAGSRGTDGGTFNYVIYDDSRIQILEENPKFSVFDDELPGGRFYGKNRSPGALLAKPETPTPDFSRARDGNTHFGGALAEEQLRRAREGTDGAALIYLPPGAFIELSGMPDHADQEVLNIALAEGYKFTTIPSLVTDGYAGNVRVPQSDGLAQARSLEQRGVAFMPVLIYPKSREPIGLVTALEGPRDRVLWPREGEAEHGPVEPKYSLNTPTGPKRRLPRNTKAFSPPYQLYPDYKALSQSEVPLTADEQAQQNVPLTEDTRNLVHRRVENWLSWLPIGTAIQKIGRLPGIFEARTKLQDSMLSVKDMVEDIKNRGGNLNDYNDSYMAEQLYHGRVHEQIQQREHALYRPLLEALSEAIHSKTGPKVTFEDYEDILLALHAPEANAFGRARGMTMDDPAGVSDAWAIKTIDEATRSGKMKALEKPLALAKAIVKDTTDTRLKGGLITDAVANSTTFENYVSLAGVAPEYTAMENVAPNRYQAKKGRGYSVSKPEDVSRKGRRTKAVNILAHLIAQNTRAVIRSEKNEVAMSFARFITENPDSGYGQIRKPGQNIPPGAQFTESVRAKYKGGEIVVDTVPLIARALNSDFVTSNSVVMQYLSVITRYMARMATQLNPGFLLPNLIRDIQTAAVFGAQFDIKNFGWKIVRDVPMAINAIHASLRGGHIERRKMPTNPKTLAWMQAYEEMKADGGTVEFMGVNDLEGLIKRNRNAIAAAGHKPSWAKVKVGFDTFFNLLDEYGKVLENALRLSAYVETRTAGASRKQAAVVAKDITVNFNRGGEWRTILNGNYLFYNAGVQGSTGLIRALKSKRVQKIAAAAVVGGFFMDVLCRLMSGDDDENGVNDYDQIPAYMKRNNWILPNPFALFGGDKFFAMPMPYGLNVFPALGRNFASVAMGAVHPVDAVLDQLYVTVDSFNPMGGVSSIANFILPTWGDPILDIYANVDHTGRNIVPVRPKYDMAQDVQSQKFWSTTDPIFVDTARLLNEISGGSEVRSSWTDFSPETLEYLFEYFMGGAGIFALDLGKASMDTITGNLENIEVGRLPILRRFVLPDKDRGNQERYYNNLEEIATVEKELELAVTNGDREEYRRLVRDKAAEVRLMDYFLKDVTGELRDLRKQLELIREASALSAEERQRRIELVQERISKTMAQANRVYYQQRAKTLN